jgi:hypothetical protein
MQESGESSRLTPEQEAELEKRLLRAAHENRILCPAALGIAKTLGIPASEVGKAANRLKIKISKCQLGCF